MKKLMIIMVAAATTMLCVSCKTGCGCPGGAGYPKTSQVETTAAANVMHNA